ncbi:hypothetical protein HDU97_004855 [Phlyctochytrium planicorne]|nr:hypothetical protein HDU97_004855 [Phlyctochytrium planicorne]
MFSQGNDDHLTKKEKRHKVFCERLEALSRDFLENKERIYFDKLAEIKQELKEILDGTHEEFEERVAILDIERQQAIHQAELYRDYQLECADKLYQMEKELCLQEFAGLKDRILASLEDKKRKLKEDRDNFVITNDISLDSQKAIGTRKATRALTAKQPDDKGLKRRKTNNTNPVLPFQLKDSEIFEDLNVLRKRR